MDPIDERLTRAGAAWRVAQPGMDAPVQLPRPAVSRWTPALMAPLVGLVAVVLAVVGVLWAVSPRGTMDPASSASPRPLARLTDTAPGEACLLGHAASGLRRDPGTGLGIVQADGTAMPVRWPYGWSAYEQAGRVVLEDDTGSPVAFDGDLIAFGSAGTDQGIQTACRASLEGNRSVPGDPPTGNLGRAFSETELLALGRRRAAGGVALEGVVAEVSIARAGEDGATPGSALVGTVGGRGAPIFITADPTLAASLPGEDPLTGEFAFAVEDDGLRLLGPVRRVGDGAYLHDLVDLATAPSHEPALGSLIAVDGWLTFSLLWCPDGATRTPGVGPAPDDCRAVRIADAPHDPELAVPVQDAAWRELGAIPGLDVELPRHGVYLLQRVADGTERDWAVIARLDPAGTIAMDLPTVSAWTGSCRGIGLDAWLTGDPSDPRVAWLADDRGIRVDIVWPPGYTARFTPALEVVTSEGFVRLRAGDHVDGGCTTGSDAAGPLLIAPAR